MKQPRWKDCDSRQPKLCPKIDTANNHAIRSQDEVARLLRLSRGTVSADERSAFQKIAAAVYGMAGGASDTVHRRRGGVA